MHNPLSSPSQGEVPKAEGVPLLRPNLVITPKGPPQSLRDSSPCKGEQDVRQLQAPADSLYCIFE